MALSHARLVLGDTVGAREAMESGLEQVRLRIEGDPYRTPHDPPARGQPEIDALRERSFDEGLSPRSSPF